jgi:hypothetical protein
MYILQIYFTWTKLKSDGRKKRDVVFRKNSGSREIRTLASCIAAIVANHYATPHQLFVSKYIWCALFLFLYSFSTKQLSWITFSQSTILRFESTNLSNESLVNEGYTTLIKIFNSNINCQRSNLRNNKYLLKTKKANTYLFKMFIKRCSCCLKK